MKKQIFKVTESDLHKIIKESVRKIIKEYHGEPDSKIAEIYNAIIEDSEAQEIAEEYGVSEEEAAAMWFKEIAGERDYIKEEMPLHREFIMDIPELDSELYHDFGAEYYFLVKKTESSMSPMAIENAVRESINRLVETDCAGVMQTGCGNAPKGSNPEAGQYTVPFGADGETSDRHKGFSVDGKAKWNKNTGNVQRRQIYNPKSGK